MDIEKLFVERHLQIISGLTVNNNRYHLPPNCSGQEETTALIRQMFRSHNVVITSELTLAYCDQDSNITHIAMICHHAKYKHITAIALYHVKDQFWTFTCNNKQKGFNETLDQLQTFNRKYNQRQLNIM